MKGYDYVSTLIKTKVLKNQYLRPFDIFIKNHFVNDITGAEIGVLDGSHADCLLHHVPIIKKLYLIDPYINYEGYENNYRDFGLENHYLIAKNKLGCYNGRKRFVKKKFQDAVDDIPDNLDFVYYDIASDIDRIKCFLDFYYPKIKENGVIGGWNYVAGHCGVARAIFQFMDKYHLELQGVDGDWWMINKIKG